MSFLDMALDNVGKLADKAVGESPKMFGDLLDGASSRIIDSMKSLPGANELHNLGFPQFDDLLQDLAGTSDGGRTNVRDHRHHEGREHHHEHVRDHRHEDYCDNSNDFGPIYVKIDLNELMQDLFGKDESPLRSVLGGQQGFEQTLLQALDMLRGNNDSNGSDKGSGGLFGDLFSGLKGILGGGSGGGGGFLGGILGGLGGIFGSSGGGGLGGILGSLGKLVPGMETLLPIAMKVAPLLL